MKFLFLWMGLFLSTGHARAGNELGNGGDGYAQEFVAIGRQLSMRLAREVDPRIPSEALAAAVAATRVNTRNRLELQGAEVDAINYPKSKRIELNRARWKEYGVNRKTSLVLHEYLGIAGIPDDRYEISSAYMETADLTAIEAIPEYSLGRSEGFREVPEYSLGKWKNAGEGGLFSLSVGAGVDSFTGNLGKLYAAGPSFEARMNYVLSKLFSLRASLGSSVTDFNAMPVGSVKVSLTTLGLGLDYHVLSNRQVRGGKGFDPYLFGGMTSTLRRQRYGDLGGAEMDNALGLNAGIGSAYFLQPKRLAIWAEAKIGQIFFGDRRENTYTLSGIPNSTGFLQSYKVGVQYYF